MTIPLQHITDFLAAFAPLALAESWDNVGLLLGNEAATINRVMTCLTLTPDVAAEAVQRNAELIVSHHPILFKPVQKLTSATAEGRTVLLLLRHGISVYSPHTAFDNAARGINQLLAERLGLQDIRPLRPSLLPGLSELGAGRWGRLPSPLTLADFLRVVRQRLSPKSQGHLGDHVLLPLQFTGQADRRLNCVGIGCGSAAEFLSDAQLAGCDVLLTGEARFHACLEARDRNIALVQAGHYGTERPGVEALAKHLQFKFPGLESWASEAETDPLLWSII